MAINFRKCQIIRPIIIFIILVVALGLGTLSFWIKKKSKPIKEIINILDSRDLSELDFDNFLKGTNPEFQHLSLEEQKQVLKNPAKLRALLEESTTEKLTQIKDVFFQLPAPVRKRLVEEAAWRLREMADPASPEQIEKFVNKPQSKAVLTAFRDFYISNLDGRQRAEVKPIADEIFWQIGRASGHE